MKITPTRTLPSVRGDHSDYYTAYLASREWAATRRRALTRAGSRCEQVHPGTGRCPEITGLEVHHRHYRTLGAEAPGDLVVLCRECHADADRRRQHSRRRR